MPREFIVAPNIYPPSGYNHAVKVGSTIYTAGIVGLDPSGKLAGDGSFEAQSEQTWKNLQGVLAAAGAKMEDVVKFTTFITKAENVSKTRETRIKYLPKDPRHSGTMVIIDALARPDLLIEVEAVAVVD